MEITQQQKEKTGDGTKKRIFVGSSVESKEIAEQIQNKLSDKYEVVMWYEGFFPSENIFTKS